MNKTNIHEIGGVIEGTMSVTLDLNLIEDYSNNQAADGLLEADVYFTTLKDDLETIEFSVEDFTMEVVNEDGGTLATLDPTSYELGEDVLERIKNQIIKRLE